MFVWLDLYWTLRLISKRMSILSTGWVSRFPLNEADNRNVEFNKYHSLRRQPQRDTVNDTVNDTVTVTTDELYQSALQNCTDILHDVYLDGTDAIEAQCNLMRNVLIIIASKDPEAIRGLVRDGLGFIMFPHDYSNRIENGENIDIRITDGGNRSFIIKMEDWE